MSNAEAIKIGEDAMVDGGDKFDAEDAVFEACLDEGLGVTVAEEKATFAGLFVVLAAEYA